VAFDEPTSTKGIPVPKLRIQLTLHYRMFIPFANQIIFRIWHGGQIATPLRLMKNWKEDNKQEIQDEYTQPAANGIYIIPIPVQYAMRLQSDVQLDVLPTQNLCRAE
jgi:hypothetical protein